MVDVTGTLEGTRGPRPNQSLKRWYRPRDGSLAVCEVDLRVGGTWRIVLRVPVGTGYWEEPHSEDARCVGNHRGRCDHRRQVLLSSRPADVILSVFEHQGARSCQTPYEKTCALLPFLRP